MLWMKHKKRKQEYLHEWKWTSIDRYICMKFSEFEMYCAIGVKKKIVDIGVGCLCYTTRR